MTERQPKCGRPKNRTKYGNALCQRKPHRLPDGTALKRCKEHLSDAECARYGITR